MGGFLIFNFIGLLFLFSKGGKPLVVDYLFTTLVILFLIPFILINWYILIPKLLRRDRYLYYLILLSVLILATLGLWIMLFLPLTENLVSDYYFSTYLFAYDLKLLLAGIIILSSMIKVFEDWLMLKERENRFFKQQKEETENQLRSLRNRINPHFLFNALNVIYSLSIRAKEKAPDAIISLSDLLRQVIYETEEVTISLEKEMNLIKAYIDFQAYKEEKETFVEMEVNIQNSNYQIYPMLLIPLIENSFKHRDIQVDEQIAIKIDQQKDHFHFVISNVYLEEKNKDQATGGYGLKHLRATLDLMYPDLHRLVMEDDGRTFTVQLTLQQEAYASKEH